MSLGKRIRTDSTQVRNISPSPPPVVLTREMLVVQDSREDEEDKPEAPIKPKEEPLEKGGEEGGLGFRRGGSIEPFTKGSVHKGCI